MGIKCTSCGWPFAVFGNCPNCGSKDPQGCGTFIGIILIIAIVVAVVYGLSIAFLISPIIIALFGLVKNKSLRVYFGIGSFLAFFYLLYDIKQKIITPYILFGYNDDEGKFHEGLIGVEYMNYIYASWAIGLIISSFYIIQAYIESKENYKNNIPKPRNTLKNETPQIESFTSKSASISTEKIYKKQDETHTNDKFKYNLPKSNNSENWFQGQSIKDILVLVVPIVLIIIYFLKSC